MSGLEFIILTKGINDLVDHIKAKLKQDEDNKPKEIQKVLIVTEPYRATKTLIDRVTTTGISQPNIESSKMINPLDEDCRILSITLIPNALMKTEGLYVLTINDVEEMRIDTQADLTDFSTINVPLPNEGKTIKRGKSIKLFVWNPSGNSVSLTIQSHFVK